MRNIFKPILFLSLVLFIQSKSIAQSIADKTKNLEYHKGYFSYWWDAANGKMYMAIDKLETPFLYVNSLPAGLGSNDIGLDRGQIGGSRIVYFQRVGKKILLTQPNYNFRAVTNDPREQKAVSESFAQSIIFSFNVEAEGIDSSNGTKRTIALVDATSFLLRDAHGVADKIRKMKQGTYTLNEVVQLFILLTRKIFQRIPKWKLRLLL